MDKKGVFKLFLSIFLTEKPVVYLKNDYQGFSSIYSSTESQN